MSHIADHDRSQTLLLPESLDDYVSHDNPVRFIDASVDGLDLAAAGFGRVKPKQIGRPGYAPSHLLKLYIYGYLNRVRSSRRLEAETFRQLVLVCRELDLFGKDLIAVDAIRIKAVNNKDRNFNRASWAEFIPLVDAKLDDYLKRLEANDMTEAAASGSWVSNLAEKIAAIRGRRERCKTMLAELDRSGESQISLTDPNSRTMAGHTHVAVGYNVQAAADTRHKLIVEQQVTNQVLDLRRLTETAKPAKDILGVEKINVVADVADRGYFKAEDIEACEKARMTPYVPRPQRGAAVKAGRFRKDEFQYDESKDIYLCPAGEGLQAYTSPPQRG
jgi:transposase